MLKQSIALYELWKEFQSFPFIANSIGTVEDFSGTQKKVTAVESSSTAKGAFQNCVTRRVGMVSNFV